MNNWMSVDRYLPEYDSSPNSFGTLVLVWPNKAPDGTDRPVAYFGVRQSDEPNFYLYGAVIGDITHWKPLPKGPGRR